MTCVATSAIIPHPLLIFSVSQSKIFKAILHLPFINPVGSFWSPILVVPRSSVRPGPSNLTAQPEPSPVRQICHKLILLRAVDRGQISLK